MNISHLMPLLSLLLLLPASSDAAIMIPRHQQTNLKPGDLCPLIQIVEHELCTTSHATMHLNEHHKNDFKELCVLLQDYNASFCSSEKEKFVTKPVSYDVMSVRILEHEYHNNSEHEGKHQNHVHKHRVHEPEIDVHKLCPIINFIEEELCTSRNEEIKVHFDPKQLCPLLNLTYTEICD